MFDFHRDLHLFVNGQEIARGCRMILTARQSLNLRPALHHLEIYDLSDSSAAILSGASRLEVISGQSVLSAGEITEVYTRRASGKHLTSVVFSPGLSLWQSSVSLSLAAGMKVSDTVRALLAASVLDTSAVASGTTIPLAAYVAPDPVLSRPQAFFGRTCDALSMLAETADADIFISSAGVCVSGRQEREPQYTLPESDLLSEPVLTGNRMILSTSMFGWVPGMVIRTDWKGASRTGRIVSTLIQADNVSGPWKSELELELF